MKLDKEIRDAIHSIKMHIFAANDMILGEGAMDGGTREARIKGKINGLETALKIIERI